MVIIFVLSENSLISDRNHKLVYIEINNHSILNMIAASFVPRDRRGIRDHIGHLISVRDVPALGTSLFVVSAHLHAHIGGGALQRPGKIFSNQQTCNIARQYSKMDAYSRMEYSRTSVS